MKDATTLGTLPNLEAFCRSFETGSFSRAAELLGVKPQATSRSVARLEKTLGVTLFRRTTRSLAATEAARCYYTACRGALGLLAEGERQLSHQRSSPSGRVPQGAQAACPPAGSSARAAPSAALLDPSAPSLPLNRASIPPIRAALPDWTLPANDASRPKRPVWPPPPGHLPTLPQSGQFDRIGRGPAGLGCSRPRSQPCRSALEGHRLQSGPSRRCPD